MVDAQQSHLTVLATDSGSVSPQSSQNWIAMTSLCSTSFPVRVSSAELIEGGCAATGSKKSLVRGIDEKSLRPEALVRYYTDKPIRGGSFRRKQSEYGVGAALFLRPFELVVAYIRVRDT